MPLAGAGLCTGSLLLVYRRSNPSISRMRVPHNHSGYNVANEDLQMSPEQFADEVGLACALLLSLGACRSLSPLQFKDGQGNIDREKIVIMVHGIVCCATRARSHGSTTAKPQVEKANNPQDQIFVFFPEGRNIGVKLVRKYATRRTLGTRCWRSSLALLAQIR